MLHEETDFQPVVKCVQAEGEVTSVRPGEEEDCEFQKLRKAVRETHLDLNVILDAPKVPIEVLILNTLDEGRITVVDGRITGEKGFKRFIEFFTAKIENQNTRDAYARDVRAFFAWCEAKGLLESLKGLRLWRVPHGFEKYLVVYRPRPDGVDVFRVLHGAREIERLLGS